MKLRVRSLETKETLKIEVPIPCTLQNLRQVISQRIGSSSPSSVHFSLNRKDELQSSSSDEDLTSLGVTSGDLIFFTLNSNSFSPQTLTLVPNSNSSTSTKTEASCLGSQKEETMNVLPERPPESPTLVSVGESSHSDTQKAETTDLDMEETTGDDCMEIDDTVSVVDSGKSFSVPGFLRKVFTKELGDSGGRRHELMVIAVHAILLESGFIGFDPVSNTTSQGFRLPNEWPSFAFVMSLSYTLPQVINKDPNDSKEIDFVVLKFQVMGNFINIYGSLSTGTGNTIHSIRVNEDQLVPFLNIAWANCGLSDEFRVKEGISSTKTTTPEAEVYNFWKSAKDMIALPLLFDLCEEAGLDLPVCFMVLPTDIKLKIIESLPGEDIAKVGSVCSELRYLTSSDNLWMQKYKDKFGEVKGIVEGDRRWKEEFAKEFRKSKRPKINSRLPDMSGLYGRVVFPRIIGGRNDIWPNLGPLPGRNIIGGDYDRLPNIGLTPPRSNARIRNRLTHRNLEG